MKSIPSEHYFFLSSSNTQWAYFGLNRSIFKTFRKFLDDKGCLMLKCEKYRLALTDMFVKSCLKMIGLKKTGLYFLKLTIRFAYNNQNV